MAKKEKLEKVKATKEKEPKGRETKEQKVGFLKKLKEELKQVKWPSFKELAKYTFATMIFVILFALFFQLVDVLSSFV